MARPRGLTMLPVDGSFIPEGDISRLRVGQSAVFTEHVRYREYCGRTGMSVANFRETCRPSRCWITLPKALTTASVAAVESFLRPAGLACIGCIHVTRSIPAVDEQRQFARFGG